MPSKIPFASLYNFRTTIGSVKGPFTVNIKNSIKAGRTLFTSPAIDNIKTHNHYNIETFLSLDDSWLVPIPGSSPRIKGGIWPSLVICELLHENGYGTDISICISRRYKVKRSSQVLGGASSRPSVQEHYDSLNYSSSVFAPKHIILVDDVVSLGRTSYACAMRIWDQFPYTDVRLFCMMRTLNLGSDIEEVFCPVIGEIKYYNMSGKTNRIDPDRTR